MNEIDQIFLAHIVYYWEIIKVVSSRWTWNLLPINTKYIISSFLNKNKKVMGWNQIAFKDLPYETNQIFSAQFIWKWELIKVAAQWCMIAENRCFHLLDYIVSWSSGFRSKIKNFIRKRIYIKRSFQWNKPDCFSCICLEMTAYIVTMVNCGQSLVFNYNIFAHYFSLCDSS